LNEQVFLNLISGKTHGILAGIGRLGLTILEPVYRAAIGLRNAGFDSGIRKPRRVNAPVISVGNLTTGGTGKTPVVALVVQILQQQGGIPGIISRGYRSVDGQANDEKRVLERLCPGVPHEQNSSRYEAARKLISTSDIDTIVMDDGYQHRQLHRELDIVLIDATNPFGYVHLLPRGLLREPLTALKRADLVLITRSDMVAESELAVIEGRVRKIVPILTDRIGRVEFRPSGLIDGHGRRSTVEELSDQPVMLVSGIGNPEAFADTCRKAGLRVEATQWFPDHHHYTSEDFTEIAERAASRGIHRVIMTVKDLVKIPAESSFLALEIAAVFPDPKHRTLLESVLFEASSDRTPG
jgi:tetraacyldisaccharide 4'-kinase